MTTTKPPQPIPLIINGIDFTEKYTPAEVAHRFRVNGKTVARWGRDGKLASVRTPGGHRRYSAVQVNDLLADNKWERQ